MCPTEIIAFSDNMPQFQAINCDVVGVSTDSHFSHLAWINASRKVVLITIYAFYKPVARGVVEGEASRGAIEPPRISVCRKFFLSENLLPKIQNLGLKVPIWGKSRGRIEILSTHNPICEKFPAVCCKIASLFS